MSENPPSGAMHGHGTSGFPSAPTGFQAGPPAWQPAPPKGQSRGLTYVALAVALVATVLAVVGWFRPSPSPALQTHASAPTYTEQQIADAKARACGAFQLVLKGVKLQTGAGNPDPESSDNVALTEAQSANARLSVVAGSWYLRDHVDPATPADIASAIRRWADSMSDLGEEYLAGGKNDDPEVNRLRNDGSPLVAQIAELCK